MIMSKIVATFSKTSNKNVLKTVFRKKHVWTDQKVVKSPFEDIKIPNVTLYEYMWRNLNKWENKTAVVCGATNREIKYGEIFRKSQRFGANLRKIFKLNEGDTVAVILPNMPEYPAVILGVLAAGGIVTTVNPLYTIYEIQRQLLMSEAKIIVTQAETVATVRNVLKMSKIQLPIITVTLNKSLTEGTASFEELSEDNHVDLSILKEVKRDADDVAFLPYSSGTTGLPKGVQLTNKNIVANCEQQNTELRHYSYTTESNQDTALCMTPMFHSYGLSIIMLHKLSVGIRLLSLPIFQRESFLDTLLAYKLNMFYMAPALVLFLGSHPQVTSKHFDHLTCAICGGAPLPVSDVHEFIQKTERDIEFCQAYGLTETSPLATLAPFGFKDYTSVGYPLPNMELRVVDQDLSNLGPNEDGELLFRGPNIMKGYKNNPEADKDIFLEDGWLRSGDLARINESGAVKITDRLKELIKVKGYQVPPAELENVLKEHPAVFDAVVVAVADTRAGELPIAFIIKKDDEKANADDILQFVNKRVAPYKKIKEIKFIDEIPRNPSGKLLRRLIKEKYCQ